MGEETDLTVAYMENLLANGPVYEFLVHDTPAWRAIAKDDAAGLLLCILHDDEIRSYERRADRFLAPLVDALAPVQAGNHPTALAVLPLRNFLVAVQIGTRHHAAMGIDADVLRQAVQVIEHVGEARGATGREEIVSRLGLLNGVVQSYDLAHVPGLQWKEGRLVGEKRLQLLDEEMARALSRGKAVLPFRSTPLEPTLQGCLRAAQSLVGSKRWLGLGLTLEAFHVVTGRESPGFVDAVSLLAGALGLANLRRFLPAHVDDCYPFTFANDQPLWTPEVALERYGGTGTYFLNGWTNGHPMWHIRGPVPGLRGPAQWR